MKKTISLATAFLFIALFFCSSKVNAQVKVYPGNGVLVGPIWWSTYPGGTKVLYTNGGAEFACSNSSIMFENYHNLDSGTWFDEPIMRPIWNNDAWIGNPSFQYWKIFGRQFFAQGVLITSDERLKENIRAIDGGTAIKQLSALNAYTYDFKPEAFKNTPEKKLNLALNDSKNQIGFLAQEVKDILPQAVDQDDSTGTYSVNYIMMIPLLVEAVKAQQTKINELEAQIALLKK